MATKKKDKVIPTKEELNEQIEYLESRLRESQKVEIEGSELKHIKAQNAKTLRMKSLFLLVYAKCFTISSALRQIRIGRRTITTWLLNDRVFREIFDEVKEAKIDFFEDAAIDAVKNKETGYLRIVDTALRTLGKTRGYTEEITSYDDELIEFTLNIGKKKLTPPKNEEPNDTGS